MTSTMKNMAIDFLCVREWTAEVWLLLPIDRFLGFLAKNCYTALPCLSFPCPPSRKTGSDITARYKKYRKIVESDPLLEVAAEFEAILSCV